MAPRRNRVRPDGSIVASASRGTYFGNRGCLHGVDGDLRRHFRGASWITCLLEFKGRHREMLVPGRFTELFFLDEATALAAGHRPCVECRRADFVRFATAWQRAQGLDARPRAADIDRVLHEQRTIDLDVAVRWPERLELLPTGTVIDLADGWGLVSGSGVRQWSDEGYGSLVMTGPNVMVVTPRATVAALSAGYAVDLHRSAYRPDGGIAPSA